MAHGSGVDAAPRCDIGHRLQRHPVAGGDPFPACDDGQQVLLPPVQGPDEFEAASIEAMDCFVDAYESGTEADLAFVLLGTEGGGFDAMLRTHTDGTVDYYREEEGIGASRQWACSQFEFVDPGLPEPSGCADTPPD